MNSNQRFRLLVIILIFCFQLQLLAGSGPQVLYTLPDIPIVDMHTHLTGKEEFKYCVQTMDEWGGTISVTLNHNDPALWEFIKDSLDGRILMAERDRKINFTPEDIQKVKDNGLVGVKTHLRYHTLPSQIPSDQIDKMGELGLPYIAMHVADPPEDSWYVPEKFMVHQQDAERVISQHPNTNFIMAHGFYLTNRDADIDTLRNFFDRTPNLYVDICCSKWWNEPEPSYAKLRKLLIDYKDRFLFGTDFNDKRTSAGFKFLRERLETDKPITFGNNGGPGAGLALPLDVLNHIYYWNAAKLIPGVKEALVKLGYEISEEPPVSLEPQPDLSYNPTPVKVIKHADTTKLSDTFSITIDLSGYKKAVNGELQILDYKKNIIKIIHEGTFEGTQTITWDTKDDKGALVEPGDYRAWLLLETNKCAETVFKVNN